MSALTRLLFVTTSTLAASVTQVAANGPGVTLTPLGSYREEISPGVCRAGISQIAAYDHRSHRLFVTNSADNALDILDIGNPRHPTRVDRVLVSDLTGSGNFEPPGVAAAFGLVALAVEAIDPVSADGKILLLDRNGKLLRTFSGVGSGPERVAFSPDGRFIVAAVQGEKDAPPGSIPKAASPSSTWHTVSGGRRSGSPVFRASAPRSWSRVASGSDRTPATPTSSSRRRWTSSRIPSPSRPTRGPLSPRCS